MTNITLRRALRINRVQSAELSISQLTQFLPNAGLAQIHGIRKIAWVIATASVFLRTEHGTDIPLYSSSFLSSFIVVACGVQVSHPFSVTHSTVSNKKLYIAADAKRLIANDDVTDIPTRTSRSSAPVSAEPDFASHLLLLCHCSPSLSERRRRGITRYATHFPSSFGNCLTI